MCGFFPYVILIYKFIRWRLAWDHWKTLTDFSWFYKRYNQSISTLYLSKLRLRVSMVDQKTLTCITNDWSNAEYVTELGRLPLIFEINKRIVKYDRRLQSRKSKDPNSLDRHAIIGNHCTCRHCGACLIWIVFIPILWSRQIIMAFALDFYNDNHIKVTLKSRRLYKKRKIYHLLETFHL